MTYFLFRTLRRKNQTYPDLDKAFVSKFSHGGRHDEHL